MIVLAQFEDQPLLRFELTPALPLERSREEHIRWVLADYPSRRLELWRVQPVPGNGVLLKMMSEHLMSGVPFDPLPIIRALGDYANASFSPLLLQTFLDDARGEVRRAAVRALGQMQHRPSLPKLLDLLSDPDPEMRREAMVALAKGIDLAVLAEAEARLANDEEAQWLFAAARARATAAHADDNAGFIDVTLSVPEFIVDLPALAGPLSRELLAELADSARPDTVRADIAFALGARFVGGPEVVRTAWAVYLEPSASLNLRLALIWMLGRGGQRNRKAIPLLSATAQDTSQTGVADASVEALGLIGDRAGLGVLLNAHPNHAEPTTFALRRLARPFSDAEYEAFASGNLDLKLLDTYSLDVNEALSSPVSHELLLPFLQSESLEARRAAALLLAYVASSEHAKLLREAAIAQVDDLTHRIAARAALMAHARRATP